MNPTSTIIAGVIMAGSIAWQFYIWKKWEEDNSVNRNVNRNFSRMSMAVGPPIFISIVIGLGVIVMNLAGALDSNNHDVTIGSFFLSVLKSILLVALTAIKSFIGIIIAGFVFCAEIYLYAQYGEFRPVPMISAILDWLFNFGPNWIGVTWLSLQVVWSIVTGSIVTFFDN